MMQNNDNRFFYYQFYASLPHRTSTTTNDNNNIKQQEQQQHDVQNNTNNVIVLEEKEEKDTTTTSSKSSSFWIVEKEWPIHDLQEAERIVQHGWEISVAMATEDTTLLSQSQQNDPNQKVEVNEVNEEEEESPSYWNQFYHDHGTRFFKDRHYLSKAFPMEFGTSTSSNGDGDAARVVVVEEKEGGNEATDDDAAVGVEIDEMGMKEEKLQSQQQQQPQPEKTYNKTLVEIGCGVGNAILPLLEQGIQELQQQKKQQEEQQQNDVVRFSKDDETQSTTTQSTTKLPLPSSLPVPLQVEWSVIHALDISSIAINLLRQEQRFITFNEMASKVNTTNSTTTTTTTTNSIASSNSTSTGNTIAAYAHVCDISSPKQEEVLSLMNGIAHVTTLLFCLSAISPHPHHSNSLNSSNSNSSNSNSNSLLQQACLNIASTLRPGGILIIRDYGRYDQAQLKLAKSYKNYIHDPTNPTSTVKEEDDVDVENKNTTTMPSSSLSSSDYYKHWYQKYDGTCCYYFTTNDLISLFCEGAGGGAGLQVLECKYIRRVYKNHNTGEIRRRIWVQGRFQKRYNMNI